MAKLILVTVGTSALFNEYSGWEYKRNNNPTKWQKQEELIECLEMELTSGKHNDKDSEYQHQKKQALNSLKSNLKNYYNNGIGLDMLSAELASLLAMEKAEKKDPSTEEIKFRIGKIDNNDKIVLLYSDTADGKLCAEVNEIILKSNIDGRIICNDVEMKKIDGLQTKDPKRFLCPGLKSLETAIKSYSGGPQDYYLNITGGFKGVLPHAADLAWRNEMDVVYLFEKSPGIIVIPKPTTTTHGSSHGVPWGSLG